MQVGAARFFAKETGAMLRGLVKAIAAAIDGFNNGIEDSSHPLRRQRQLVLTRSLSGMADTLARRQGDARPDPNWDEHHKLGRMECSYGRPLNHVLQAPWAASQYIVAYASKVGSARGLSTVDLQEIAEVVIDWSAQISVAFGEGYSAEHAEQVSQRDNAKRGFIDLALSDAAPEDLATAAARIGWNPPPRLRVLIAVGPEIRDLQRALPTRTLSSIHGEELQALVPPDTDRYVIATVEERPTIHAVLGPAVDSHRCRYSATVARRWLNLRDTNLDRPVGLIDTANLTVATVLLADQTAALELRDQSLLPIMGKPDLIETLSVWLAEASRPVATAVRLGVHRNTVRYRVNRLRVLLGDDFDTAPNRLRLGIACLIHLHTTNPDLT